MPLNGDLQYAGDHVVGQATEPLPWGEVGREPAFVSTYYMPDTRLGFFTNLISLNLHNNIAR